MTSSEVTQKSTQGGQQVAAKQPQYAREEKEESASASASAGVCFVRCRVHEAVELTCLTAQFESFWRTLRSLLRQI